jgi:hypothetical protein
MLWIKSFVKEIQPIDPYKKIPELMQQYRMI